MGVSWVWYWDEAVSHFGDRRVDGVVIEKCGRHAPPLFGVVAEDGGRPDEVVVVALDLDVVDGDGRLQIPARHAAGSQRDRGET